MLCAGCAVVCWVPAVFPLADKVSDSHRMTDKVSHKPLGSVYPGFDRSSRFVRLTVDIIYALQPAFAC